MLRLGGRTGAGVAVQGNILAGPAVVDAMFDAWLQADPCPELARLLDLHTLYFGATRVQDQVPLDQTLRAELDELARAVGRADLDAWVAAENFENRVSCDAVDRQVLEILRASAARR